MRQRIFCGFISAGSPSSFDVTTICSKVVIQLIACILKVVVIRPLRIVLIRLKGRLFMQNIFWIALIFNRIVFVVVCLIFIFTAIREDIITRRGIHFKSTFSARSCSFSLATHGHLIFLCGSRPQIVGVFRYRTLV